MKRRTPLKRSPLARSRKPVNRKVPAFIRALKILDDHPEGLYPETFYALMWPEQVASGVSCNGGRVNGGSSKGGPSNMQCAANWLLGRINSKYPYSVYRYDNLHEQRRYAGRWFLRDEGRQVLDRSISV